MWNYIYTFFLPLYVQTTSWWYQVIHYAGCPRRVSNESNVCRITTKFVNILRHPEQRKLLVPQSQIPYENVLKMWILIPRNGSIF